MPSTLPIYAARLRPEEVARLEEVRARAAAGSGLPLSQSDLIRLAIPLLEAAFPPAGKKAKRKAD